MSQTSKYIYLTVVSLVSSLIFALVIKDIFNYQFFWYWNAIIIYLSSLFFMLSWAYLVILVKNRLIIYATTLFDIMIFFLILPKNYYYLITIILLIITMIFYAFPKIIYELNSRVKINLDYTLNIGLKMILIFLVVFVTISYYQNGKLNVEITIPEKYSDLVLESQIPGYYSNLTFDELVYLFMLDKSQFKDKTYSDVKNIISDSKESISIEQFQKYKDAVVDQWNLSNLNIIGSETLSQIQFSQKLIGDKIVDLQNKYHNLAILIIIFAFFELVYWVARLTIPLTILIGWLVYKIMIKARFIDIEKTSVIAEKIKI